MQKKLLTDTKWSAVVVIAAAAAAAAIRRREGRIVIL